MKNWKVESLKKERWASKVAYILHLWAKNVQVTFFPWLFFPMHGIPNYIYRRKKKKKRKKKNGMGNSSGGTNDNDNSNNNNNNNNNNNTNNNYNNNKNNKTVNVRRSVNESCV